MVCLSAHTGPALCACTASFSFPRRASPLYPGERDTLDEIALCEEEEDDHGEHGDGRRCHEQSPLRCMIGLEQDQPELDCPQRIARRNDERPEEVVPRPLKGKERKDGED